MITRQTLSRIPLYAPVARDLYDWARERGPGTVRTMLDKAVNPPKVEIQRWLNESPDPGTRAHRLAALYVTLADLEARV